MRPEQITIDVDPQSAQAYRAASDEQRRKINVLLSLRLHELARPTQPLDQLMREVSARAQERGLTPEILKSILNGG